MNKFWEIKNITDVEGELILYGDIVSERPWWDWEEETITQKQFIQDLKNLGDKEKITVRINSLGGDVFAANAIYTQLKLNKASIEVVIDGIAASAATIVAMAGDKVIMPVNAMMMIHNPLVGLIGYYEASELTKISNMLEKTKESIINGYLTKSNLESKKLNKLMNDETWLTAEDAKNYGFADEILFENSVDYELLNNSNLLIVAGVKHDISKLKNKPSIFTNKINQPLISNNQAVNINNNNQKEEGSDLVINSVEELKEKYPEFTNQIKNEGVEEERQRIKAIEDIATSITPELVNKAKFEDCINAEQLALEALKNNSLKGKEFINNLEDDISNSNINNVTPLGNGEGNAPKPKKITDHVKSVAAEFDSMRRGVK